MMEVSPTVRSPEIESRTARWVVGVYGAVVYAVFLPVFLYLIGFVGGWFVPHTVYGGAPASFPVALIVNLALIALFGVQHVIMARPAFKKRWTRVIPAAAERATFVLAVCVCLAVMFTQWRAMPGTVWNLSGTWLEPVLTVVSLAGWAIVLLSTFLIDHFDLFGIKQALLFAMGKPYRAPQFKVRAFYRHVRHPLYLGLFLAFWAAPHMSVGRLVFAGAMTTFTMLAVRLEERDLRDAHPEYDDYAANVPMILPRPKLFS